MQSTKLSAFLFPQSPIVVDFCTVFFSCNSLLLTLVAYSNSSEGIYFCMLKGLMLATLWRQKNCAESAVKSHL